MQARSELFDSPVTSPRRYLLRMVLFIFCVGGVVAVLFNGLEQIFLANPPLNGLIAAIALLGILYIFRQVQMLYPELAWIESYRGGSALSLERAPRLVAPMATMLGERREGFTLSALAMRSLLDGIASRLDESRDLSRYMIGLLIFLGLLGTFWGLQETIRSIGGVVSGLSAGTGDAASMFDTIKRGLAAPLHGMGTSFSSSLFGLSGSLVLGFLDLQAAQAQNRFYNELEEWLSGQTRLTSAGAGLAEIGDQRVPAYLQALMEQMAETMENLQRSMARGEEERVSANSNLVALTERLATLTDQMRTEQTLMIKLAEAQLEMRPILSHLADSVGQAGQGFDDATRSHIRNLDTHLGRLIEEVSRGRTQMTQELRSEIKLLARTIAALAEEPPR